jgi:hypothetical protein
MYIRKSTKQSYKIENIYSDYKEYKEILKKEQKAQNSLKINPKTNINSSPKKLEIEPNNLLDSKNINNTTPKSKESDESSSSEERFCYRPNMYIRHIFENGESNSRDA